MNDLPDVCGRIKQKVSDRVEPLGKRVYHGGVCRLAHLEKEFSKGELIFGPCDTEDRVFEIKEGEVEIFQLSPNGKKVIIDVLTPGNIFTSSSFSDNHDTESHDFALARSKIFLCILQKSDFMEALQTRPRLAVSLIREISIKLNEADDRIRNLALSDTRVRLVSELMRLGKKFGIEFEDKVMLELKFTHEELAEMIGTTRETVTRMLLKLRQDKIVYLDKSRHIVVYKQKANEVFSSL